MQDKYLERYHFSAKHSLRIDASPEKVWPVVEQLDFSGSKINKMLFALRGLPAGMMNGKGLQSGGFILLDKAMQAELIMGLVGQFWKPNGNLQVLSPAGFIEFGRPGFLKATWNFKLIPEGAATWVETETRVFCTDENARRKFSRYWFFVRPFSGIVRKEILKAIKKKAEAIG